MELGDGLKKLLLAGVGTVAVTAEKSKEILDELVKKGELTVEQGKVLNQELKHNIKETIKTKTTPAPAPKAPKEDIKDTLAKLSPEQLAELKEQILKMEAPKAEEEPKAEEAPKEEAPAAAEEPAQETTEE
jgi:polyhydroxyalkanoate synthesis regulator phasin